MVVSQPGCHCACFVLWVVIMLKNSAVLIQFKVSKRRQHMLLQDTEVEVLVHCALDLTHKTRSLGVHAVPNHHMASAMFHGLLYTTAKGP